MNLKQFKEKFTYKNNDDLLGQEDLSAYFTHFENLLDQVNKIHNNEKESKSLGKNLKDHTFNRACVSINDMYFINEETTYYFIGDIHSDSQSLFRILEITDFFERANQEAFKLIFLGDYVDRGENHLKTIEIILTLKTMYPSHVILLMGNHDIGHIEAGEVTLYLRKAEEEKDYFYYHLNELHQKHESLTDTLLNKFLHVLNTLNVIAFIKTKNKVIQAVHGGIVRPVDNFSYINSLEDFTNESTDPQGFRNRDCLLWSDPSIQHKQELLKQKRFKFYEEDFRLYQEVFGIDLLFRGHQAMEDGVMPCFDETLYTVFSSGLFNEDNTDTRYDFVTPKIIKYTYNDELEIIGL